MRRTVVESLLLLLVVTGLCIVVSDAFQAPIHRPKHSRCALDVTTTEVEKDREGNVAVVSNPRLVAVKAILVDDVRKKYRFFPLRNMDKDPQYLELERRDRAMARMLALTACRHMGQIDKVLALCLRKRQKRKRRDDLLVEACLRIGAAEILFLDTPPYAACKETVNVLRQVPSIRVHEAQIKFVNAILRRLCLDGKSMVEEHTHERDNLAPWLLEELTNDWGDEKVDKIVKVFPQESPWFLSVNHPVGSTEDERTRLENQISESFDGRILPQGSIRVSETVYGPVHIWPGYYEGLWFVQDPSATLPALALKSALDRSDDNAVAADMHVVDMCAAPGGKTSLLATLGFGKITAVEKSERRSRLMTKNGQRLGYMDRCEMVVADGTEWVPKAEDPPVVGCLVDAPCSATGTARKNPDVLHRNQDLGNLLEMQEKLAFHCADNVLSVGGILIYATCSLLKRENEDLAHRLLDRSDGESQLVTVPFEEGEIPGYDEAIDENGWLRVLPGALDGDLAICDGFFVARFRKVA